MNDVRVIYRVDERGKGITQAHSQVNFLPALDGRSEGKEVINDSALVTGAATNLAYPVAHVLKGAGCVLDFVVRNSKKVDLP